MPVYRLYAIGGLMDWTTGLIFLPTENRRKAISVYAGSYSLGDKYDASSIIAPLFKL